MKKIVFILLTSLFLLVQNVFAQAPMGDFYATDTREFGFMNKIVKANLALQPDGTMKLIFGKNEYILQDMGGNQYQSEDITDMDNTSLQLFLREDKDWILYLIEPQLRVPRIQGVFLLTVKKEEAKERWKKVKDEYTPLVGKTPESQENIRFAYYYTNGENKTAYIKLDKPFAREDEVRIYVSQFTDHTFKKLSDNTYIYSRAGAASNESVSLYFARFFPAENKILICADVLRESQSMYIAQLKNAPDKNPIDDKRMKEFSDFVSVYITKYRKPYFENFKNNISPELPATKINTLVKEEFEADFTITQAKLITKSWDLERNEFGRVLSRSHNTLVYLKDKKTGKCHIAFRIISQEFDGNTYGEPTVFVNRNKYYSLEDEKRNDLFTFLMYSTYEVPCNEISK
jgi:hypothetical protein